MDLTGPGPVLTVGALLVLLVVLSMVDRPRPRGRVLRLLARGTRVVGVGLVAVLLAALVLNNQYLFYTSWSDLVGPASHGSARDLGDSTAAQGDVPGEGLHGIPAPAALPALPNPGRRLQELTVPAPALKGTAKVLVHLPRGYDPAKATTYPVVVGLHGFPGNPRSFIGLGITDAIDGAIARGELAPSIVVIPEITAPESLDTECVDGGPGQPQVDTWLARDLPAWIVGHVRARTDRLSWATLGYSYGGWCAASLGLRHPDVYGAAVVLQGYFRPDFGRRYVPTGSDLAGYDLVALEETSPVPVSLWVMTSREDNVSYPSTAQFFRAARTPTSVTAVVLPTGGHRIDVWQPLVPDAVTWLGRTLPGFRA